MRQQGSEGVVDLVKRIPGGHRHGIAPVEKGLAGMWLVLCQRA